MDGNDVDERLERLRLEQVEVTKDEPWRALFRPAVDAWERATEGAGWERYALLGSIVLVLGTLVGAIFILANNAASGSGDDNKAAVVASPQSNATETKAPLSTATTAKPTTSKPTNTAEPSNTEAIRTDCDEIQGTAYRSEEERAYYQEHCLLEPTKAPSLVTSPQSPATQPPSRPSEPPPPPPPADTPVPVPGDSARATGLAVSYIEAGTNPQYDADAASCSAVNIGDHWIVTCNAHIVGCGGTGCDEPISVCVYLATGTVRPSSQC